MKVRELIDQLSRCDPDAEVLFHQKMDDEDRIMDMGFTKAARVVSGFAIRLNAGLTTTWDLTIYPEVGSVQGYAVDLPVVGIVEAAFEPVNVLTFEPARPQAEQPLPR